MFSKGKLCKLSRTFKMYNRQFIQFARIPVEFVARLPFSINRVLVFRHIARHAVSQIILLFPHFFTKFSLLSVGIFSKCPLLPREREIKFWQCMLQFISRSLSYLSPDNFNLSRDNVSKKKNCNVPYGPP